jgi:predicted transcriptional regulator
MQRMITSVRAELSSGIKGRIIPTPSEMKRWRLAAGLTQREMGEHLEVDGSYVAYLESGKRSPSATVIARYWKIIPR